MHLLKLMVSEDATVGSVILDILCQPKSAGFLGQ